MAGASRISAACQQRLFLNHAHPPGSQIGSRGVRSVTVRRRAAAAAIAVGRLLAGRRVHGIANHAFLSACSVAESADESAAPARQQTPQSGPHENALPSTISLWPPGAQPGPGPLYTIPPLCKAFYRWCVVLLPVAAGEHAEHPRGDKKGRSSATGEGTAAGSEQRATGARAVAAPRSTTSGAPEVALKHCKKPSQSPCTAEPPQKRPVDRDDPFVAAGPAPGPPIRQERRWGILTALIRPRHGAAAAATSGRARQWTAARRQRLRRGAVCISARRGACCWETGMRNASQQSPCQSQC